MIWPRWRLQSWAHGCRALSVVALYSQTSAPRTRVRLPQQVCGWCCSDLCCPVEWWYGRRSCSYHDHVLWYLQQHMAGIMQSPSGHSLSSLECCAGAPAPAVVNPEDIDLGNGMEEDDEAEEPAAEVQLQQKAVPVRLVSSNDSLPAPVVDTAALKSVSSKL